MTPEAEKTREDLILEAEVVLSAGKGHLGVINMLRSYGMDHVAAKKASYDIFDQAKIRLMKSLRLQKGIVWLLIIGGLTLPLVTSFLNFRIYIFSLALICIGIYSLNKIPNPSRLPENNSD